MTRPTTTDAEIQRLLAAVNTWNDAHAAAAQALLADIRAMREAIAPALIRNLKGVR